MQPAKKAKNKKKEEKKEKNNNKYLYRPVEVDYHKDLCSGEYYTKIIYYLI